MWSHERNVRSLAKNVLGSMRMGTVRGAPSEPEGSWPPRNRLARLKNFADADAAEPKGPGYSTSSDGFAARSRWSLIMSSRPPPSLWFARRGWVSSEPARDAPASAACDMRRDGTPRVGCGGGLCCRVAPVAASAADWIDCRRETSSTQYGTSCATSGKSTAQPCMNLENLCTSVSAPLLTRSVTHDGASSPAPSASLISKTACGNRVCSVR